MMPKMASFGCSLEDALWSYKGSPTDCNLQIGLVDAGDFERTSRSGEDLRDRAIALKNAILKAPVVTKKLYRGAKNHDREKGFIGLTSRKAVAKRFAKINGGEVREYTGIRAIRIADYISSSYDVEEAEWIAYKPGGVFASEARGTTASQK